MRVVLDPNVLISASIAPRGIPKALLDAWTKERFELIVSPELLAELEDVLSRERLRRWLTQEEVTAFVAKLRLGATLVDDPPTGSTPITADPHDDYLVALAQAARADYLVSKAIATSPSCRIPIRRCSPRASSWKDSQHRDSHVFVQET